MYIYDVIYMPIQSESKSTHRSENVEMKSEVNQENVRCKLATTRLLLLLLCGMHLQINQGYQHFCENITEHAT